MFKGFRTLVVAFLAAILPVLETLDLTNLLGQEGMAIYAAAIALLMAIMRVFSNTPVGKA